MEPEDVGVAVTYNPELDQFLLLKRNPGRDRYPGKWEFPSGFVEKSEDPRDGALRELEEETGLVGNAIRTGEPFEVETERFHFLVHPVLVKVDSREVELTEEHLESRWIDLSELQNLDHVPKLEKDLEAVGISPY